MAGINPEQEAARLAYYQSRRKVGRYLNRNLSFYSGAPSIPQSFTGNLLLVAGGTGPGAKILNGIEPFVPTPLPCEEPIITSLVTAIGDDLSVTVLYNVEPGDVYVLFNTSDGTTLPILSVIPVVGGVVVTFDDDSPPATPGSYTFKIIRAGNLDCFTTRSNVFQIFPAVCLIVVTGMSGDGVFPNFPLIPGSLGHSVTVTGSGFLAGPLTITIVNNFPPFNTLIPTLITVVDDNTITIDFDAPFSDGFYEVTVALTSDPTCFGVAPGSIGVIGV